MDPGEMPTAEEIAGALSDAGWSEAESPLGPEAGAAAIATPLRAVLDQVRSRDRVRDLAEVFTHQREVDAMLDLIPDAFTSLDAKFLEPSCGSGNFLVEILRRKLRLVAHASATTRDDYEHQLLRAIASIYAVDISMDNITEARGRLAEALLEHVQHDPGADEPTTAFLSAVGVILEANVVCGDLLSAGAQIELCDWQPHSGGGFRRVWSHALVPPSERDLFWMERVQDREPCHFSKLGEEARGELREAEDGVSR